MLRGLGTFCDNWHLGLYRKLQLGAGNVLPASRWQVPVLHKFTVRKLPARRRQHIAA